MPTTSYSSALLAAGTKIWTYPRWQERTKFIVPPFSDEATPKSTGLSKEELSAVKAFSDRIHSSASAQQLLTALGKERDNDRDGRRAWEHWTKKHFNGWGIVKDIESVLMAEGRHPRQLIGQQGFGNKVPPMEEAAVVEVFSVIAEKLFGEDAFRAPDVARPIVRDELYRFISAIVAHVWNKMRKTVVGQYDRLQAGKALARDGFDRLNNIDAGAKVDMSDIKQWFKAVDSLKILATSFSDEAALEELDSQIDKMNWVYKVLTGDNSPLVMKGLSKNLRDALKYMATHEDISALRRQLVERIEFHKLSELEGAPAELDLEPHDLVEWTEGVEHLKDKTPEELYSMLGFKDNKIPYLVEEVSVEADLGALPLTDEDADDVASEKSAMRPFSLQWHQLVGVVKLVECALTSRPVMLMDDVGIGKTLQVIGFFAVMAYYRKFQAETERYPGIWGGQEWTNYDGKKRTLPNAPFLFVVPPSLVDQVAFECNRFLQRGAFDVIKYVGGYKTHKDVWGELDARSHHDSYMCIYIASTTAVQADSMFIHLPCPGARNPRRSDRADQPSIFGRRYLALAIDEAHAFRNPNKVFTSMRALREKVDLLVAMTATPVQTRPLDLWHIGKVVGLPGFKDDKNTDEEIAEMKRDLARAKRDDKRMLMQHAAESRSALHRMFHGQNDEGAVSAVQQNIDENYHQANAKWMKIVREKFQGAVIRRTGKSLDYQGRSISGLEPYYEHICMLRLYTHEYDALETLAERSLDSETFAQRFSSENFYLDIRRCLLHPCFAKQCNVPLVTTIDDYRTLPSCKLDSLVEILNHHLATDNAPAIQPSRQRPPEAFISPHASPSPSQSPLPIPPHLPQQQQESDTISPPDKIIIYSYFPTSFDFIKMVLDHNNIRLVMIEGKDTQRKRVETLQEFKRSGRDGPRVLLISSVGALGLNIAFANILVIVDVLWSVMSDQQLIGRVWRRPQNKRVHIYRLIGGNSPDILLNNLSFSKGLIQETFLNIGDSLRKALEQRDSDDITLEETSFTEQEPVPAESSSASTTKAKGKSRKKSEAQASEATAPRAQTKKVKRRSHAATVAPAPAAIAAVVQDAITAVATGQDTTASEAMSRMTLAPLELGSLATADPSSVTPQKHALVYPPSPKTLQELPSTIIDLEALLPKFDTPPIDTVEDDAEDEITLLAMAERPDFEKFILCNVAIIKTHRRSINQHDHAKLWTQLQEREQMLDWYFLHYTRLAKQKGVYRANTEPEVDPIFGPFDGMDVDLSEEPAPLEGEYIKPNDRQSSPLSSVPPSPRLLPMRSATPSASSTSTQSKRSRELSPEGHASRRKRTKQGTGATTASQMQRTASSGKNAPAEDRQFLTVDESSARPRSKQVRQRNRREFTGDDSESILHLAAEDVKNDKSKDCTEKGKGQSAKGGKGKGRA